MRVEIVDATHQRFNGVTYRRNKRGWYQRAYSTLHRDVWTWHNGTIPPNHDIHHVDFNKDNNQIENLQCLSRRQHLQLHHPPQPPKLRECTCQLCGKSFTAKSARKRCDECIAELKRLSEEKKLAKKNKPPKPARTRKCIVCGKEFELKPKESISKGRKACSTECHDKLVGKLDDRICLICGKSFHPKRAKQKCCSPKCGAKFNEQQQRGKLRAAY